MSGQKSQESHLAVPVVGSAGEEDSRLWQRFVDEHPDSTNYHRWGWKHVIENAFGWPTYYLMARSGEQVEGVLPLVLQKSRLFGTFLTSMPFLNAGGVVVTSQAAEQLLIEEAIRIARRAGARHLELRHRNNHHLGMPAKTSKVVLVKAVDSDTERMFRGLDSKLRSDIRKAMKHELVAEAGGIELLAEFYEIFAQNMRDLGTPVYSSRLFREILRVFPENTYITMVRHDKRAIASSFLTGYRDTVEAAWSSSLRQYLPLKPNMILYWKNLCVAAEKGYRYFDFGRSSAGSGTHKFKLQWEPAEIPLHWDYWLAEGDSLPELNPEGPRYRLAIRVWQKLPVALTKLIGPRIVRCLP